MILPFSREWNLRWRRKGVKILCVSLKFWNMRELKSAYINYIMLGQVASDGWALSKSVLGFDSDFRFLWWAWSESGFRVFLFRSNQPEIRQKKFQFWKNFMDFDFHILYVFSNIPFINIKLYIKNKYMLIFNFEIFHEFWFSFFMFIIYPFIYFDFHFVLI